MSSGRLLYVGGIVVDFVYRVEALPVPGAEVIASQSMVGAAGGFNTMASASRSGATVVYCGQHGTGFNGEIIRAALNREAITTLYEKTDGADNGSCIVLVTTDGERTFVYAPGCEFSIGRESLSRVVPRQRDWVLVSGYSLVDSGGGVAVAEWLETFGKKIPLVVDPSPLVDRIPPSTLSKVLNRTTWLTCNSREARLLTGLADPQDAAEKLVQEICPQAAGVLLRMSSEGCLLQSAGRPTNHLPAFKTRAIDSTGAGDTHTGVFLAAMLSGIAPEESAVYANAAAAISVTRSGGSNPPTKSEIFQFLEQRQKLGARKFPTGSVTPHLGG